MMQPLKFFKMFSKLIIKLYHGIVILPSALQSNLLPTFQIANRSDFNRYVAFAMHIEKPERAMYLDKPEQHTI